MVPCYMFTKSAPVCNPLWLTSEIQVPPWAALIFGSTAAAVCFGFEAIKWLEDFLEEPLHITIIHGVGGLWGMLLTGIFAEYIPSLHESLQN